MKILVVDHNAVDPLSQSIYRELAPDIRVIVPNVWFDNFGARRAAPVRSAGSFEVVPVPAWPSTRTHRLVYRGICRHIRDFHPDIFYVNSEPENFSALECALLSKAHPEMRFVFSTWRNIDYSRRGFPYRLSRIHAMAERSVLGRADHAIAFTPDALPIFSRLGFSRMTHIPPEVDTTVFKPGVRKDGRTGDVFTVGYAGRLHPLKGVDILLEAISMLPPSFRLIVAGDGTERKLLRQRCLTLRIDDRVQWRGSLPRARMPELLGEMDVLVLPSRTGEYWKEQFGRVLIEAMACGVPVVGSDSGSIPAVVGNAGVIVREGDIPGLRDALLTLRDSKSTKDTYRDLGLSRVAAEYALPVVASRYRVLMDAIIKGPGHSLEV